MNDSQFEAQLGHWLAEGPRTAPARLAGSVASYALAHPRGRFGGWRALMAGAGVLVRPAPIALRPLVLLVLLALTFALGAAFYAAWHNNAVLPLPSPTVQPSPGPAGHVCPPGSAPNAPGSPDQARPWVVSSGGNAGLRRTDPITFDSSRGQVLVVTRSPLALWTFDVCSNTWAKSDIDLSTGGGSAFSFLVYDPTLDTLFAEELYGTQLGAFDLAAGTHALVAKPPFALGKQAVLRPATDQLIVRQSQGSRLASYDVVSASWAELAQFGEVPPAGGSAALMAYDESADLLVLYSSNSGTPPAEQWQPQTYEYDFASSTWTLTGDAPELDFAYGLAGPYQMAYDASFGRVVLFNRYAAISYDAASHHWDSLQLRPYLTGDLASWWNSITYDSVNHRIVVLGPYSDGVFAVDAVNETWQLLLSPTEPYLTPPT